MTAIAPFLPRFSLGLLRRLARAGASPAGLCDASAEAYARDLLARRGPVPKDDLTADVRSWLARRERGIGGGVADLGMWGDALWQGEAEAVVDRVLSGGASERDGQSARWS